VRGDISHGGQHRDGMLVRFGKTLGDLAQGASAGNRDGKMRFDEVGDYRCGEMGDDVAEFVATDCAWRIDDDGGRKAESANEFCLEGSVVKIKVGDGNTDDAALAGFGQKAGDLRL